jgi:uncharacterized membrane protein YedE/YeeE
MVELFCNKSKYAVVPVLYIYIYTHTHTHARTRTRKHIHIGVGGIVVGCGTMLQAGR